MGDKNYSVELRTYGDESLGSTVAELFPLLSDADFLLGGTLDGQTAGLAAYAHAAGKVMVAGVGSMQGIFQGRPTVFGTLSEYSRTYASAVETVAALGARTMATVVEDHPIAHLLCNPVPAMAAASGIAVVNASMVSASLRGRGGCEPEERREGGGGGGHMR